MLFTLRRLWGQRPARSRFLASDWVRNALGFLKHNDQNNLSDVHCTFIQVF